ncbi:hypothetical protein DKY63_29190 [Pseudomonas putida]|uniref:Uncharacterized protein n=1 Tax=Pseudomonas putida TaxID=303 RepID=A0A2Z4RVA3_PSEPU|nr:hypothetical protein [Pseudomonas putida]AWY43774.1 hypothetical protein DKY63_29190 [Pseudomonas putida]
MNFRLNMPNSVEITRIYNKTLYEALLKLFTAWGDIPQPEDLAWVIAHQSAIETEARRKKLIRGLNVTERIDTARRYLESLRKARKLWHSMENEDQISLSKCVDGLTSGHGILDVPEYDQINLAYLFDDSVAEWRKPVLNQHAYWSVDTEMIDLLIGAAQDWLENKAPVAHEKIDPTLDAVIYMCGNCNNHNIIPSASDTSRFTKVVSAYFEHTDFLDADQPEEKRKNFRKEFKDVIKKANAVWARDYPNTFMHFKIPAFPEQLDLFRD